MSRAALLSTCGDVFITSLLLKIWRERWRDEIDHLYINFNNHCGVPPEVVSEFVKGIANEPKITFVYHPTGIGNGPPQVELLKLCNEDLILLLEDDGFIFTTGKVDECFKKIESGETDILWSPRFSCGNEIGEALRNKYQLDYAKYGDCGPNGWPNFLFCKKSDLLRTDLNFGSYHFKKGQYYPELNFTMSNDEYGDTFVWACIQLRNLNLRITEIPQFHMSPTEVEDKERGEFNWYKGQRPYWYHAGSLSAGWNGYLGNSTPDLSNKNAILEIESRCAWWMLCSDLTEGFETFKREYKDGINNLIQRANLDKDRIKNKYNLIRNVMAI